jgi:hypothetical protein
VRPRFPAPLAVLLVPISLASPACIEDRLAVDITTVVHGDGACTRRTVYRLERVNSREARLLLQKDNAFATEVLRRLEGVPLRGPEVARAFRDVLATPFAAEVSALANRPVYGPRERRDVEALGDRLTALSKELTERLVALAPGLDPEKAGEALDSVFEAMGEPVGREMSDAGFPLPPFGSDLARPRIHFHATLVMPAPIVRANTCASGDTAVWDFDGDDLYGRGFEMWATAGAGR